MSSKFSSGLKKTAGLATALLGTVAKKAIKNPLQTLNVVGTGADAVSKGSSMASRLSAARDSSGSMLG